MFGGRPDFYKHSLDVLSSATPEQLRATARRWLTGNALALEVHPFAETLAANGGGADRTRLPMPATFPQTSFPSLSRASLSNGMRIIVAERHAVPVVQLSLQLDSGFASDQFATPGVASVAMEMLDEGTATMDALEISDTLAGLGADLATGANLDYSVVSLSALKEHLDASLAVYADVILNPAFAVQDLDRVKRLAVAGIQQEKSTPTDMALRILPRLLYGDGNAYSLAMTGSGHRRVRRRDHARGSRQVPRQLVQAEQRDADRRRRHDARRNPAEARGAVRALEAGRSAEKNAARRRAAREAARIPDRPARIRANDDHRGPSRAGQESS